MSKVEALELPTADVFKIYTEFPEVGDHLNTMAQSQLEILLEARYKLHKKIDKTHARKH